MSDNTNKVTFVLTGPREGSTVILNNRYGFKDGELTVDHVYREPFRIILCTHYCCNIKGEAPLWRTETDKAGKKASVKITDFEKPAVETTIVKSEPSVTTTDGGASAVRTPDVVLDTGEGEGAGSGEGSGEGAGKPAKE